MHVVKGNQLVDRFGAELQAVNCGFRAEIVDRGWGSIRSESNVVDVAD